MLLPRKILRAFVFVAMGLTILVVSSVVAAYSCIKIEDVAFSAMCVVAIMFVSLVVMIPLLLEYQRLLQLRSGYDSAFIDDESFWAAVPSDANPVEEERVCIVCLQGSEINDAVRCDWGESVCCKTEFHKSCVNEYFRHRQTVICPVCRHNENSIKV